MVLELRQLYAEEVLHTDQLVGDFMDAVREVVDRPMTVIFTSGHGEMLGEHGLYFNHRGIYDETIRVPLMVSSHKGAPLHQRIPAQVRLMDIPNTVLAILGIDQDDGIESGDLTTFMEGTQQRGYGTFLMGQMSESIERGSVFGYRAAKADGEPGEMLKFIWNPGLDHSWLYDLVSDAQERADMSGSQASVVTAMQTQVRKELATAAPEGTVATEAQQRAIQLLDFGD
jgi:choline-sulfatase